MEMQNHVVLINIIKNVVGNFFKIILVKNNKNMSNPNNTHTHSFSCLGNSGSSTLTPEGEWVGNNATATGQTQAITYSYDEFGWVSSTGARLGTLQATPVNWVLSSMRYEVIMMPTISARFEIRINCDWCEILQTIVADVNNYDVDGLHLNVDKVREQFIGSVYNDPLAQQNNADFDNPGTVSTQWKMFIETILKYTAWVAVDNAVTSSRTININKVKTDLTFVNNINQSGITDDPLPVKILELATEFSHRCILGLYQDTTVNTQQYDSESIGQLINNTNMQEILTQLRDFGAFGGNLSVPEVNPVIGLVDVGNTTHTYRLFKRGDCLAFPINIKSIIGHTAQLGDVSFNGGFSFINDENTTYDIELRIIFQQSIDTDDVVEPTDILDEWKYHDTLRWHEPSKTFQTIRYDQYENMIIITPTYDENGNRIADTITPG